MLGISIERTPAIFHNLEELTNPHPQRSNGYMAKKRLHARLYFRRQNSFLIHPYIHIMITRPDQHSAIAKHLQPLDPFPP